jgi:WD40 repeat protein
MWSLKKNKPLLSKRIATYRQTLGMEFVTPARAFQSEHSPLENVLVVSDNEGYMHVLSPVTLESFAMWKIHSLYSWCVRHIPRHAPSGDMADRMISASGDETIIIWDLHTGKVLVREKGAGSILSIELVPSLNLVYAGSSAGIITAYSMTDLTSVRCGAPTAFQSARLSLRWFYRISWAAGNPIHRP